MRQTATPLTGPKLKAAIRAGSSEKSMEIKLGIRGTLKLNSISTAEIAPKRAVMVILRMFTRLF